VANRRVFYDFTFSPPKSVSVVALLRDERIGAIHDQAVRVAVGELERYAETRVRRAGQDNERMTGNLVAATFRHETSRELDPHLHTHCVIFNATFDPVEQRWKALQAAGMYRVQKLAENCYYHELCRGLRKLGYEIEPNRRDFEIKHVPQSVIARFSKRHDQIEKETKQQIAEGRARGNVKDLRERIARDSRKWKIKETSSQRLMADWARQLSQSERTALRECGQVRPPPEEPRMTADEVVGWADEHLFERRAVVNEHEIIAAALARGWGGEFDVRAIRDAMARRDYVREEGSAKLTSRDVLRCELALVFAARDGRGAHVPLAPTHEPRKDLSPEQALAVRQILGSRDFITLFRGGAGTGKSFALQEVKRGLVSAGRPVVVVAPQRQQVSDLTADGLPAETLAHLLAGRQMPRGAVVMVDEAGQIGARDMHELVALAKRHGARLILSGDTRQHGAVAASDALRAIEAYGGIKSAEIEEIRRQDPNRAISAPERSAIARYRTAVKAAADGDVALAFERLDRLGWIRELGDDARRVTLAYDYVSATQRKESALVVGQTWEEVRGVNEAIRRALLGAGRLKAGATVSTFRALDTTTAQRRDPSSYAAGQHVFFTRRYGRFAAGDVCEVIEASARGLALRKDGRRSTLSFRYADRLTLVEQVPLEIAAGDRLQLKFNGRSAEGRILNNGELVTVRTLRKDGGIVVVDAAGGVKTLSAGQRLFNRGYAVTSYASQGKTVDTVLFSDASNRAATNRNQWYVAISRGRKRVVVYTSNKAELRTSIQRVGDRALAIDLAQPRSDAGSARALTRRRPKWAQRAQAVIRNANAARFLARLRHAVPSVGYRANPERQIRQITPKL
jgi:conjugative relaxase-like TrwC/TraI family protein